MSYVRRGDDSDVYVIGTTDSDGKHVLECCGCTLIEYGPAAPEFEAELPDWAKGCTWALEPYPAYVRGQDMLDHFDKHRSAGQKVPDRAYDRVRADDWPAA